MIGLRGATAAVLFALGSVSPLAAQDGLTVVLVRHAEKAGGTDPALTEAGAARAEALRDDLADFGVDAVVVSQFRRTHLTAQPLARQLGLMPVVVPVGSSVPDHIRAVVEAVHRRAGEGAHVVLVVGHSNTIPAIARALGGAVPDLPDEAYDDLFVVRPSALGRATTLRTRYGAPDARHAGPPE